MQALEKIERWVYENIDLSYKRDQLNDLIQALIEQIHTPKDPETIPFTWPVPHGYEVYTRDGRKVTQLVKFDVKGQELCGVFDDDVVARWSINGSYYSDNRDHNLNLSLRKIAPEMVTVWLNYYPDGLVNTHESQERADIYGGNQRIGPAIRVQFEKPKNS